MSDSVTPSAPPAASLSNPVYALPLAAAAIEIIGSISPWAKGTVGENGLDTGGKATLALAAIIVTLVILAYRHNTQVPFVRLLINAVLVIVVGLANIKDVHDADNLLGTAGGHTSVGFGLWLTILGGIFMAVVAFRARGKH